MDRPKVYRVNSALTAVRFGIRIHPKDKNIAKSIFGWHFCGESKMWSFPYRREVIDRVIADFEIEEHDAMSLEARYSQIINSIKHVDKVVAEVLSKEQTVRVSCSLPPYKHQAQSIKIGLQAPYFCDFSEPGTGKTYVQCIIMDELFGRGQIYSALVVCPKTIIQSVWMEELSSLIPGRHAVALTGTKQKKMKLLNESGAEIFVINYESASVMGKALLSKHFDYLVADETVKIKNYAAKMSKIMHELAVYAKRRAMLTGIPTPNSMLDIFSQFKFLDLGQRFGDNYWHFRDTYYYQRRPYLWLPVQGAEEKIRDKMFGCAVRHLLDECEDMPEQIHQNIGVDLSKEQKVMQKQIAAGYILTGGEKAEITNALTAMQKLRQVTGGYILIDNSLHTFKTNPKMEATVDLVNGIPLTSKVIVWCQYRAEIHALLEKFGDAAVSLYGGNTDKDREANIKAFKEDPSIRVCVANPKSTKYGLTLTEANYCIWYSIDFSYEAMAQANARIRRLSQTQKTVYYYLVAKDSIDEYVMGAIKRKRNLNAFAMRAEGQKEIGDLIERIAQ